VAFACFCASKVPFVQWIQARIAIEFIADAVSLAVRAELVEVVFASCAGGSPASRGLPGGNSLFFCFAKRKVSKRKGDPAVCVPPSLSLRRATCGARSSRGRARTRLRLRQSLALIRLDLRSSAHTEGWGMNAGADAGRPDALCASGRVQLAVMYARGRSTRGQMRSPSIAQRGEGGARGGSGESVLLPTTDPRRSVMQATRGNNHTGQTTPLSLRIASSGTSCGSGSRSGSQPWLYPSPTVNGFGCSVASVRS
jgi:hypothetical protein